jgi:hypothetical protein
MVIRKVIKASGATLEGENDRRIYTKRDNSFYDLLESVLGAQMMRIFLDHSSGIGYRTVEKLLIFLYKIDL